MKKIYTFIAFLLVAGITFGQMQQPRTDRSNILKSTKKVELNRNSSTTATIDTAGWTTNFTPQFMGVDQHITTFIMGDGSGHNIGYWFGTSGPQSTDSIEPDYWAQCWDNTATLKISGILFWADGKTQLSSGTGSNLIVGIMKVMPYVANTHGCVTATTPSTSFGPSPVFPFIKFDTVNIADFDTTFTNFNWAPFASMATITGTPFAAVANFKAMRVAGDTAYMFCDATTNGLQLNYTQYTYKSTGYYWMSTYLSGEHATLDVNMSIFAVIDDGAGINDEGYFQGMKMTLRNNPSSDVSYVDYVLQKSGQAKLVVLDSRGREVASYNEGSKNSGDVNSISINTSKLDKGTYFLMLSSGGGRFTKKLVVQ
jgi:hypothetical protein